MLQTLPFLSRDDVRRLVVSFGSVAEFARNIYDQELDVLLGSEKASYAREYLAVNRPFSM